MSDKRFLQAPRHFDMNAPGRGPENVGKLYLVQTLVRDEQLFVGWYLGRTLGEKPAHNVFRFAKKFKSHHRDWTHQSRELDLLIRYRHILSAELVGFCRDCRTESMIREGRKGAYRCTGCGFVLGHATCDKHLADDRSPVPHEFDILEVVDLPPASGGSYEVRECRRCGRVEHASLRRR